MENFEVSVGNQPCHTTIKERCSQRIIMQEPMLIVHWMSWVIKKKFKIHITIGSLAYEGNKFNHRRDDGLKIATLRLISQLQIQVSKTVNVLQKKQTLQVWLKSQSGHLRPSLEKLKCVLSMICLLPTCLLLTGVSLIVLQGNFFLAEMNQNLNKLRLWLK